jgi:hypothetical protein
MANATMGAQNIGPVALYLCLPFITCDGVQHLDGKAGRVYIKYVGRYTRNLLTPIMQVAVLNPQCLEVGSLHPCQCPSTNPTW